MATRYVKNANKELGAAFDPATQDVQNLNPTLTDLYQNLVGNLSNQQAVGEAAIAQSADRKGVNRRSLADQLVAALGQETAVGAAQLGAGRAEGLSEIQGALGELGKGRQRAAVTAGGTRQDTAQARSKYLQGKKIDTAQARLDKRISVGEYRQNIKELERKVELAKQSYAVQQARAASYGGGGGGYSSDGGGDQSQAATPENANFIKDQALAYFDQNWQKNPWASRQDQDNWINNFFAQTGIKDPEGRQPVWDYINKKRRHDRHIPENDWLYAR